MQQSGPTEIAVSRLKGGASVTQLLHEANGPALGDYLFQFLRKTPRSVETIAGLAGLNKSSLYRILNAEVSPHRNVLLPLSRVLSINLSETHKLGFIGAHDIPLCNLGAAGMIAGAHYADPACEVLVDYANGWAEVNGCYELATSMNQQGASLIYHTASAGGLGILNAGKEHNFLTIFFDGNLNADAPETNIASAIRDFPACAKEAIQDVIDGKFTAGSIEKGIAEDSLYLDFDGSAYEIPAEVMEQYNAVVAAIKDGTIVVPSTIEDAKAWQAAA